MASLTTLPAEILSQILSYLVRPFSCYPFQGKPRTMPLYIAYNRLPDDKDVKRYHPYNQLAATCHAFREAIERYCAALCRMFPEVITVTIVEKTRKRKHGHDAEPRQMTAEGAKAKKAVTTFRSAWLTSVWKSCMFCKKSSSRRGIFDVFMWVCNGCDLEHFGKAITKTAAEKTLKIKPIHYITPHLVFPNEGIKPPQRGIHAFSGGVWATLLLESDAEALSAYVKEHDPDGKRTRAATKLERQLEAAGSATQVQTAELSEYNKSAKWLRSQAPLTYVAWQRWARVQDNVVPAIIDLESEND